MSYFGRAARVAALTGCGAIAVAVSAASAAAAVFTTDFDADLTRGPITFSYLGGSFTFANNAGDFFSPLVVSTGGTGAVRTVFGNPSTDFPDRGTVIYGSDTLGGFGSFSDPTVVRFSNGGNLLGLRVTSGGQDFFGFAQTTDRVLNNISFETRPGVAIDASAVLAGAVPEPSTWALLILGFGAMGVALRGSRKTRVKLVYA